MKTLVESIAKCLSGYEEKRVNLLLANGLNIDKRVIDNSKISDHHAIISTNLIGRLGVTPLNDNEKNVAELVINRFLCALDKPHRYTETKYEFSVEGEIFKLTVKRADEWGWKWSESASLPPRKVTDSDDEEVQPNITYSENDTFTADNITVKSCETQPPKRFTESSLLAVMENIDRLIPDKDLKGFVKERGLGTPATRASIIEELIAAGYVQRKKKQLVSTEYGRAFAASLPESVKSAELTAHWEQSLSDIENGTGSAADLLAEIEKTVNSIITIERGRENRVRVTRKKSLGNCPRCGQPVVEGSKGFYCTAGRENCGFFIWGQDKRIGRKYTAAEISELLSSGKVTLKNCVSSKGNRYSAVFEMEDTGQYVNLKLVEFVSKKNGK